MTGIHSKTVTTDHEKDKFVNPMHTRT